MNRFCAIPWLLVAIFCLSGCAGYVGGDLRNTKSDYRMSICGDAGAEYQVTFKTDAENDEFDQNISGFISGWTLGIVPTYWTTTVHSEATILRNGIPAHKGTYESRVHKFYGILWAFLPRTKNSLPADEGGGIRVEWGIRDRTLYKVISEHGGKTNQYCLIKEEAPAR